MIELKQISFSYPDEINGSLENIELSVKKGEFILLCGRSGCGKTTITKIVFVVSHDYEFISRVCSRIIRFDNGTVTADLEVSIDYESEIGTMFGINEE